MNKKVAFCINDLPLAGAENVIFNTYFFLLKQNLISKDSFLILLSNKLLDDYFLEKINEYNINYFVFFNYNHPSKFKNIRRIFTFFLNNNFDTFHVNLSPALFAFPLLKFMGILKRPKLIFTEHSTSNNRPNNRLYLYIESLFYLKYDNIVCISEFVKQSLILRLGSRLINKTTTISNGLFPLIEAKENENIRKELNISNESKLLLMTSRIGDGKDHLTLIKAFEDCFAENLYLIFIGSGNFKTIINKVKSKKIKNNIISLGIRKDARKIMNEVDINILSSKYEGVSGVTLEAFFTKKPYLGSNVEGIKDLVGTDKSLFNFGDHKDLATKIVAILNNTSLSKHISNSNFKKLSDYDYQSYLKKILNLY